MVSLNQAPLDMTLTSKMCQIGNIMEKQHKSRPNRIAEIRKARGWTQEYLAERVGTTPVTVSRLENGQRELRDHWARQFASALRVSEQDVRGMTDRPIESMTVGRMPVENIKDSGLIADMEIRGERSGLSEGVSLSSGGKVIGYTPRRADLADTKAFAVPVIGKMMEPRYKHDRDLVICNPDLKPMIDEYVVIVDQSDIARIRLLTAIGDEAITVQTHNPQATYDIPLTEIRAIYPIIAGWAR